MSDDDIPAPAKIPNPLLYRILFQRGVYPADDFHMVKKYGQTVLITQDLALENYLEKYSSSPPLLSRLFSHPFFCQDFEPN